MAKTLEDCITNAYLNYLLDPGCKVEPWPVFLTHLVQELLDSGEDMRVRKLCTPPSRGFRRIHKALSNKRPRPGSDESLLIGERCPGGHHIISQKFLELGEKLSMCVLWAPKAKVSMSKLSKTRVYEHHGPFQESLFLQIDHFAT